MIISDAGISDYVELNFLANCQVVSIKKAGTDIFDGCENEGKYSKN